MSIRIMSESEYAQQRRAETLTPTLREIIEKTDETPAFIDSVNAEVMASILSSAPAGLNRRPGMEVTR